MYKAGLVADRIHNYFRLVQIVYTHYVHSGIINAKECTTCQITDINAKDYIVRPVPSSH